MHLLRFGEPVAITEGEGSLVAFEIASGSGLDGRTVAEAVGRLEGTTAVAVLRDGDVLVPRGPTRFRAGDRLLAIVKGAAFKPLQVLAEGPREAGHPID